MNKADTFTSVWEHDDASFLERALPFYARAPVEPILDATYNAGRFWKGSTRRVVGMDIDASRPVRFVMDNRTMRGLDRETGDPDAIVPDASFGVVVFDPPHVGNQGRDKSTRRFDVDYGATFTCGAEHGWTLSFMYPAFLTQARRVLIADGLLFAKITDQVNCHRSRWAHVDFMRMAETAGFTVCDLIVKVRKGPMMSNKWKRQVHARKRHCFWIVCRNSNSCE